MKRIIGLAAVSLTALHLGGCGSSSGTPGPGSTSSGNGDPATGSTTTPAVMRPLFVVSTGVLPYPTDLYFAGSTDGTLRLPSTPFLPNAAAINSLDGFSTTAPITVRFSAPLNPATITPAEAR